MGALEARVAAMQAVVAMSTDDTATALQKASHELAELRVQVRGTGALVRVGKGACPRTSWQSCACRCGALARL